jgi:hypothetical protein
VALALRRRGSRACSLGVAAANAVWQVKGRLAEQRLDRCRSVRDIQVFFNEAVTVDTSSASEDVPT